MAGQLEQPLTIGRIIPLCFSGVNTSALQVDWCSNKKSMDDEGNNERKIISKFDNKMKENMNVVPVLDNATSHPNNLLLMECFLLGLQ